MNGKDEDWLFLFKNETHNHPTEIEPFGGAATCIGGAIRDPLSGRSYVYQAMRVTGAGDPLKPVSETLPGKLPQRKLVTTAAAGYSSYGNQIGLATGPVSYTHLDVYKRQVLEGAYSLVIMSATKLIAVRDPRGYRPLCIGTLPGGGYVFASESCALDAAGATLLRDVEPGEIVVADAKTDVYKRQPIAM